MAATEPTRPAPKPGKALPVLSLLCIGIVAQFGVLYLLLWVSTYIGAWTHYACLGLRYLSWVSFLIAIVVLPLSILSTLDENSPARRKFQVQMLLTAAGLAIIGGASAMTIVFRNGGDAAFKFQ
jgi:hypothetical protein